MNIQMAQLSKIQLYYMILLVTIAISCNKTTLSPFCEIQRVPSTVLINKEGTIVYSNKFNRYGIDFHVTNPNNIDSKVTGLVCELPLDFQKTGLRVFVSGSLMNFNNNENMFPEMGGQELYFCNISSITK